MGNAKDKVSRRTLTLTLALTLTLTLRTKYHGGPALPVKECLGPCPLCEASIQEDEERRRREKAIKPTLPSTSTP